MSEYSPELIRLRLQDVRELLDQPDLLSLLEDHPDQLSPWQRRIAELETHIEQPPEIHIALIGSTGAGKSSLLNAVLGSKIMPVDSMKPCTSVVTSVRYSEGQNYRAQIRFLTEAEWQAELESSLDVFSIGPDLGEEEQRELTSYEALNSDWNLLKKATQDKIKAIYGEKEFWQSQGISLSELVLPDHLRPYLAAGAPPVLVNVATEQKLKDEIIHYLDKDQPFWPLIKSVELEGPFQGLPPGAVLVDLPGVNDPNQAREEVTRRYLQNAPYIWVVFPMKRGITKDIRQLLIEQKMLRQFLIEGKVNALTLVGTHADDYDDSDAQKFGLPEDAEPIEIIRERNLRVIGQVTDDLQEMAGELGGIADADSDAVIRLRQTLLQTRIFTTSTPAWLKLRKITRSRKDYGIADEQDTGIPDLIEHLKAICQTRDYLTETDQKISLLIREIESFFRAQRAGYEGKRGELYEQLKRLQERLAGPRSELEAEIRRAQERAQDNFQAHRKAFAERLTRAIEKAVAGVEKVRYYWQSIHLSTLRAVVLRKGKFTSIASGKRHDFNADIAEPLLNAIPFVWDDFFGHYFDVTLTELKNNFISRTEVYLERLKSEALRSGAFDEDAFKTIAGDVEVASRLIDFQVNEVTDRLRSTIARTRVELASLIGEDIEYEMQGAYDKAGKEKGTGMKQRILSILTSHASRCANEMFEIIRRDLLEGVQELGVQLQGELQELVKATYQQADRVSGNLGGGKVAIKTQDTELIIKRFNNVLRYIEDLEQRMLAA